MIRSFELPPHAASVNGPIPVAGALPRAGGSPPPSAPIMGQAGLGAPSFLPLPSVPFGVQPARAQPAVAAAGVAGQPVVRSAVGVARPMPSSQALAAGQPNSASVTHVAFASREPDKLVPRLPSRASSPMRSQSVVPTAPRENEPATNTEGVRLRLEWQRSSSVVDQLLRGPADHILNEPGRADCRLCHRTLTGDIVVDEQVVANHRLVVAMDHAWATCERFHEERGRLRHQALEKRRELEDMKRLVDQLRAEFPEQVHSYVKRSLAPARERQVALKKDLDALYTESLLGFPGVSRTATGRAPSPSVAVPAPRLHLQQDGDWSRFCDSVKARIAAIGPSANGGAAGSEANQPMAAHSDLGSSTSTGRNGDSLHDNRAGLDNRERSCEAW